ncbi:N-6 DNA methylase [Actinomadura rupiterrae]|uniref:N-6 DNA methylase n=1 Tax=Actinomadura rupiterrae TaxID=559627 RepID=UPI0020A421BC|nr:N-6 DNA methylase [Actinomadura rupiterrae]MCP2342024.1 SAM-dependent methyltransferase [Actinomadura rupiterrae]
MSSPSEQMTAAEISRLAKVTRATVSNWRRRHPSFPAPSGGNETSPTYDRAEVEAWLRDRGQLPEPSPDDKLRNTIRVQEDLAAAATRALAFVLAAARMSSDERTQLAAASNFLRRSEDEVSARAGELQFLGKISFDEPEEPVLRAALDTLEQLGRDQTIDALTSLVSSDSVMRGVHFTPQSIATLMAGLIDQRTGYPTSVFDPACGTGGLLEAARRQGATRLFGQDLVAGQAASTATRLAVGEGEVDVRAAVGDSLRDDAFPELAADAVLCHPPFGDRDWGHDELGLDGRWAYGLPPKGEPELAWLEHCLAHVRPGGTAVILLPPGVASRAGGRRIRSELVRQGAVRAVIAIPAGIVPPLHVPLHLWVLRNPEGEPREADPVLFVNAPAADASSSSMDENPATTEPVEDQLGSALSVRVWRQYAADPTGFDAHPGLARGVPALELLDDLVDLTPARYVHRTYQAQSPKEQSRLAHDLRDRLARSIELFNTANLQLDWRIPERAHERRSAMVNDLVRGGAITLHRVTGRDDSDGGVTIQRGDVLLPEHAAPNSSSTYPFPPVLVAGEAEDGTELRPTMILFRPDPERLDPWFLAGFLSAEENVSNASIGTSLRRIDPKRLRVPLMPLEEQRRYGAMFRRIETVRKSADTAYRLATDVARQLRSSLTSGALQPANGDFP